MNAEIVWAAIGYAALAVHLAGVAVSCIGEVWGRLARSTHPRG